MAPPTLTHTPTILTSIFFSHFFYYFTITHGPTNFNTHANYIWSPSPFFFLFFFSFPSPSFSVFVFSSSASLLLLMLKQEAKERKLLVVKLFFFFFFEKMVGKLKKNINLMFWSGYIEEAVMKYSEALSCYWGTP